MQTINKDIKDQTFRPAYLLYGEEDFLKNSLKNRLIEAIVGEDRINFSAFEGKNPDLGEVMRLADTLPFFAERRLILLEDTGLFKSGGDDLCRYLSDMPDTVTFLFVESAVDRRSRLYKKVNEIGYATELGRQSPEELARWAAGLLKREGKKITSQNMELFLGLVGDDMENIRSELDKLIGYTGQREVVTQEDIYAICTEHITGKVFDLVADLANGRKKQAMDRYEDLLTLKETPLHILFLIGRQFAQFLQVKELTAKGADRKAIARRLKLQPYVASRVIRQAGNFTQEEIRDYLTLCVETEEAVKTGRLADRLAVELLIAAK